MPKSTYETTKITNPDGTVREIVVLKPGIKTTEFWVSLIAAVIPPLMAANVFPESTVAVVMGVLSPVLAAFGYSLSRGIAKI